MALVVSLYLLTFTVLVSLHNFGIVVLLYIIYLSCSPRAVVGADLYDAGIIYCRDSMVVANYNCYVYRPKSVHAKVAN